MPRKEFGRRDGLDGLAQAHLVADQGSAGAYREERALGLVWIQRRLEQLRQLFVGCPAREQAVEDLRPPRRIAPAGDKVERIVVGTQFVAAFRRRREELLQLAEALLRQDATARAPSLRR
jgi:hypothetical protein